MNFPSTKFIGFASAALTRRIKAKVLSVFLSSLHRAGFLNHYISRRLRSKALVLMYHRVLAPEDMHKSLSHPGIIVSTSTFEMHVRFLQRNFKMLSLGRFLNHIRNRIPFEDRSCLITFDDGWRDNFTRAFPILQKYGVPAVIFLTSDFIDTDRVFWQERLSDILARFDFSVPDKVVSLLSDFPEVREDLHNFFLSGRKLRPEEIALVSSRMKSMPQALIENLLARLDSLSEAPPKLAFGDHGFLSWDEVRQMAAGGVEFGSHGASHAILTVDENLAAAEIATSKTVIEGNLGHRVSAFSYPNGNHSGKVVALVQEIGYQAAFGTLPGYVTDAADPFRIQRINVHDSASCSLPFFLGRIAGLC